MSILVGLPLYVIAFLIGLFLPRRVVPGTQKISLWIIGAIVVLSVLALLLASLQVGAGFYVGIFLGLYFAPPIALAMGLYLATVSRQISDNKRLAGVLLGFLCLFVPIAFVGNYTYKITENSQEYVAGFSEFQLGTVEAYFGERPVTLPTAPQFIVRYFALPQDNSPYKERKIGFKKSYTSLDPEAEYTLMGRQFFEITAIPVQESCSHYSYCTTFDELKAFCANRLDLVDNILCDLQPRHALSFSLAKTDRLGDFTDKLKRENWVTTPISSLGVDATNAPIKLHCNATRDNVIATNGGSRLCMAQFSVTPFIIAEIRLDKFDADDLEIEAQIMLSYTQELWATISPPSQ